MPDWLQQIQWPGAVAIESFTGTISHGISPSTFCMSTSPQPVAPNGFGDLVMGDGQSGTFRIHDCKIDRITSRTDGSGTVWTLEILDRRWRWRFGRIDGNYNQTDTNGKLVPWSIRSPTELAVLCLQAMGETNYSISLPPGLPAAAGANLDRILRLGENFVQTLSNPPTVWDGVPPAEALARLADRYGCRVVFQPIANRVLVTPIGYGAEDWPNYWPAESIAPSINSPEAPSAVGVMGAHIRYQVRLELEPVGEEWDGSYLPIDQLSYAPLNPTKTPQISDVFFADPVPETFRVEVAGQYFSTGPGDSTPATTIGAAIAANAAASAIVTVSYPQADMFRLTGKANEPFAVSGSAQNDPSLLWIIEQQVAVKLAKTWVYSNPRRQGGFRNVQPTDRLSFAEAKGLAEKTVFRCYRITGKAPGGKPLVIPDYGPIKRRQQILLLPVKVAQVVPQPRDKDGNLKAAGGGAANGPNAGILPEFYNGFSRDQESTVTGSIWRGIGNAMWLDTRPAVPAEGEVGPPNPTSNTPANKRLYISFSTIADEQMIVFGETVYEFGAGGQSITPTLTLECAVLVQDATTSAIVRSEWTLAVGGPAPVQWQIFDDVEYGVIGKYDAANKLTGFTQTDYGDATQRAATYLKALAAPYRIVNGETRRFIGLRPIDPTGSIQQVSWEIGGGGPATTASINDEHSQFLPSYPARRRIENLSPNAQAALANVTDRGGFRDPLSIIKAQAEGLK